MVEEEAEGIFGDDSGAMLALMMTRRWAIASMKMTRGTAVAELFILRFPLLLPKL